MSAALIEGISMGLLLSAMVGPVFFTLIQSSLTYGFRYASILALGILSSEDEVFPGKIQWRILCK